MSKSGKILLVGGVIAAIGGLVYGLARSSQAQPGGYSVAVFCSNYDDPNNPGISGATVKLDGRAQPTNTYGVALFTGLAVGTYNLQVSAPQFMPMTLNNYRVLGTVPVQYVSFQMTHLATYKRLSLSRR